MAGVLPGLAEQAARIERPNTPAESKTYMAFSISNKSLRIAIDIAIVLAAITLGTLVVKRYFLNTVPASPVIGAKILLEGVDWSSKRATIVLVLDKDCRLCTVSAPFYERLVKAANMNQELQLVAVTPDDTSEGRKYLNSIGISIANIRQSALSDLNVPGTPTVLEVDSNGRITESWVGTLNNEQEINLLRRAGAVNGQ